MNIPEARDFLATFLFRGDDVFKQVAVLSGGERNRLQLAKLVVTGPNVLLLDEPTNHLDIPSRESLENALRDFSGTVFFVTHDRFLLNRVATHIWEFGEGGITTHEGNYEDLRRRRAEKKVGARNLDQQGSQRAFTDEASPAKPRLSEFRLTRLIEETETRIAELEAKKQEYEVLLATPATYQEREAGDVVAAFRQVSKELEDLYDTWVGYRGELEERRTAQK